MGVVFLAVCFKTNNTSGETAELPAELPHAEDATA